ncbi:MAG: type I glyceraldehyde-3-phosphate dehydrogenase [Candidatus Lokiarchaeota archaeon]|nr:type I glyceraldehyde-3-phosphate dehydrogenase [Candidatus Lokiarchaeota archaeon]
MTHKVAINGMGRIGRATLKILMDTPDLELVAVNDIVPIETIEYLLKYDTVYGKYKKNVKIQGSNLVIDGKPISYNQERDPTKLPWSKLQVELVFECTGIFTKTEDLRKHIQAGAKYVVLSAPTKSSDMPTIVHGVNSPEGKPVIFSCASCTTNCITPVVEIMDRRIGVEKAIMTTVHAYTSTQSLVDGPVAKDVSRGRAAALNFVPTTTGAAIATTLALPNLKGRFDGVAIRGPVPVGSIADITFITKKDTSAEEIEKIFREEAETERYKGILGVADDPIVSSDIIGDPRASVVDPRMTTVVSGNLVKIMTWYDNEWGYCHQMVREAIKTLRN